MTETDRQEYKEKIDKMIETIDYRSLIHIITELMSRVEQLEKVNKENLSLLNLVEKVLNE